MIVLASETDMVIFHPTVLGFGKSAFFTRNPTNPNWRQYEMAGISHLPEPILPLGLPNQNTADARPIFRAAFDNLTKWTHGKHRETPPAARYFRGQRRRDRCLHPDDGCSMAISPAAFDCLTSSRGSTGALPARRSAATRRSILSGSTRSTRSCSSVARSRGSATTSSSLDIRRGTGT